MTLPSMILTDHLEAVARIRALADPRTFEGSEIHRHLDELGEIADEFEASLNLLCSIYMEAEL